MYGFPIMPDVFMPGDKVIAYYASKQRLRAWYKAVVVRVEHDGSYLVRWEANRNDIDLPAVSSVDAGEIKRRSDRGSYSGF
jgi:hypothetical protein